MPTKRCSGCQAVKGLEEFTKKRQSRDGRDSRCKACRDAYMREYYTRRFGRRRPVVPDGFKSCPRCKQVLSRERFGDNAGRYDGKQVYCIECWPAFNRYALRSPESRFRTIRREVERYRRNPIKQRACLYVSLAVYFGDLQRAPCEVCGEVRVQAHHEDYQKPLQVRWLCKRHHDAEHRAMKTRGGS